MPWRVRRSGLPRSGQIGASVVVKITPVEGILVRRIAKKFSASMLIVGAMVAAAPTPHRRRGRCCATAPPWRKRAGPNRPTARLRWRHGHPRLRPRLDLARRLARLGLLRLLTSLTSNGLENHTCEPTRSQARPSAALLIAVGLGVGCPTALADEPYADLVVDPNTVTDSTAYAVLSPPIANPDGLNGVSTVYTHRDSTRTITDTILVLPDSDSATGALQSQLNGAVVGGSPKPAASASGGTMIASATHRADRGRLTVLGFTQGEHRGHHRIRRRTERSSAGRPDLEIGQAQDTLIKDRDSA